MTQITRNFKNVFTSKGNNFGLFFKLSVFALFGMMILFSGQISAQQTCTPSTTVTDGDLFPGGIVSFGVTSGPGLVRVDHIDAGTGLQSLTVVGLPINAVVNIPAFVPGTLNLVSATFTLPNPNGPVDFTMRAASTFHAIFIRVRCVAPDPTPTPTPTPTPQGCTRTQGYWKNHAEVWTGQSLVLGTNPANVYTQAQLLSIFREPVRGNGLISLSHQLIAAKLNAAAGTTVPASVAMAISNADTMIGGLVVPPVGSGFLPPSMTSALTSVLDTYNNGNTSGGPPHCN